MPIGLLYVATQQALPTQGALTNSLEQMLTVPHPHPLEATISICPTDVQLPVSSLVPEEDSAYAGWQARITRKSAFPGQPSTSFLTSLF